MSKDGKTTFVNDMTKLTSPSCFEYDFQLLDTATKEKSDLKTILETSTNMDMADVVAKVLCNDTDVQLVGSAQLKKSECILADESGNAKLILWQGDIDKVIVGEVYAFGNIRVREDTIMDTSIEKQSDHRLKNLDTLPVNAVPTTSSGNGSLIVRFIHSVEELVRYKVCCDYKRKIQQDTGKAIVKCDSCSHVVRSVSCSFNVFCKFSVKKASENSDAQSGATATSTRETEVDKFVIFKDILEKLIGKIEFLEDEEIYEKLLTLENFKITFTKENIVGDVQISKTSVNCRTALLIYTVEPH